MIRLKMVLAAPAELAVRQGVCGSGGSAGRGRRRRQDHYLYRRDDGVRWLRAPVRPCPESRSVCLNARRSPACKPTLPVRIRCPACRRIPEIAVAATKSGYQGSLAAIVTPDTDQTVDAFLVADSLAQLVYGASGFSSWPPGDQGTMTVRASP